MSDAASVGALLRAIDRLEQMLEASELVELEVEAGGTTFVLRKPEAIMPAYQPVGAPGTPAPGTGAVGTSAGLGAPSTASAPSGHSEGVEPEPASRYHAVVAPLTGVFYDAPSPGAAAYVGVGSPVSQGQVIGLIEAMKLFNEIKSDVSGIVRRLAADTGSLVKAKQTLIEVEVS